MGVDTTVELSVEDIYKVNGDNKKKRTRQSGKDYDLTPEEEAARDVDVARDQATEEYARPSLAALSKPGLGTNRNFSLSKEVENATSNFSYSDALRTARFPVPRFFTYDGAQHAPTLTGTGKVATSVEQILPVKPIPVETAVSWNRVGSKKGWTFNGPWDPTTKATGDEKPTSTFLRGDNVGYVKQHRWIPLEMTEEAQQSTVNTEEVQRNNLARGATNSDYGKVVGGLREFNKERAKPLTRPQATYNFMGSRPAKSARTDMSGANDNGGAGGFRSGRQSHYPEFPQLPKRRSLRVPKPIQPVA